MRDSTRIVPTTGFSVFGSISVPTLMAPVSWFEPPAPMTVQPVNHTPSTASNAQARASFIERSQPSDVRLDDWIALDYAARRWGRGARSEKSNARREQHRLAARLRPRHSLAGASRSDGCF